MLQTAMQNATRRKHKYINDVHACLFSGLHIRWWDQVNQCKCSFDEHLKMKLELI